MKHILVIEDEINMCLLLEEYLLASGYRVSVAINGDTGLKMAQELYPDLILLDLTIPKLSGEEVCRSIKHSMNRILRDIPIIMITGKNTDVDRVVGMVMGAADYVSKPFSLIDLKQRIEHIFKLQQAA